jgi:hypothetical protein
MNTILHKSQLNFLQEQLKIVAKKMILFLMYFLVAVQQWLHHINLNANVTVWNSTRSIVK